MSNLKLLQDKSGNIALQITDDGQQAAVILSPKEAAELAKTLNLALTAQEEKESILKNSKIFMVEGNTTIN